MLLYLPEDKKERAKAYRRYIDRAISVRQVSAVEWRIITHYLKGCRDFPEIDYVSGRVHASYQNPTGGVPFKYEGILNSLQTEVGRLTRLDVAPAVTRTNVGLNSLREESTAQAILDAVWSRFNDKTIKDQFFDELVEFGLAGLFAYNYDPKDADKDDPASSIGIEVVPPWEILFLPATARASAEVDAVARIRWVSLDWARTIEIDGKKLEIPKESDPDLKVRYRLPGEGKPVEVDRSGGSFDSVNVDKLSGIKGNKVNTAFVKMQEIWSKYSNGRLKTYAIMLGDVLAHTKDWDNSSETPMSPMQTATRGPGLYGRSYVGPLIPLNHETEAAVLNLLRNVQDLDLLGMTGIPVSWGVSEQDMQGDGQSRRFFFIDKDPSRPNEGIERIQPNINGTMPDLVINMALGLLDRTAQQPEMITEGGAPGRVDSQKGLEFLYRASTIPLGPVAAEISQSFGGIYKWILHTASKWDSIVLNMETLLDNAVIGIKFDPESGRLLLGNNVVPDPVRMSVGIRSEVPVDKDERKSELYALLDRQLISPEQFRIIARTENLDMPLGDDAEWQNYRLAVMRAILVFNDGETPGDSGMDINQVADYEQPVIQLMVLQRIMASPEFAFASDAVQTAFKSMADHLKGLRGDFPDSLAPPEDQAELDQQTQGADPLAGMPPELSAMAAMGGQGDQGGIEQPPTSALALQ